MGGDEDRGEEDPHELDDTGKFKVGNLLSKVPSPYRWATCIVLLLIIIFSILGLENADRLASVLALIATIMMAAVTLESHRKSRQASSGESSRSTRKSSNKRASKGAVITVSVIATFSCNVTGPSSPNNNESRYECSVPQGYEGTISPTPVLVDGTVFCPVEIDDGRGTYEMPFNLSGQIVGTRTKNRQIALFVRIDPSTCDTNGRPGGRGRFLLTQVSLDSAERGWSYNDNFGDFPPGITFGRIYEFASLSRKSLEQIEGSRTEWGQNGISDDAMPDDVKLMSRFYVPPGRSAKQVRCG